MPKFGYASFFVLRRHVLASGGVCRRVEGRVVEWRGVSSSGGGMFRRVEGRVVE